MGIFRPSPLLYVGQIPSTPPPLSSIPTLPLASSLDTGTIPRNSLFRRWDFVSQFNEDCLTPKAIEPLRFESDRLADRVVEVVGLVGNGTGRDAYVAVKEYLEEKEQSGWEGEEKEKDPVWRFWQEMIKDPPEGVHGFPRSSSSTTTGKEGHSTEKRTKPLAAFEPVENDMPTLAEGQRVFWKYSGQIFGALMHFSLAGGFSSPKLAAVMHETNYLTSNAREATYKRLLETTLFVLDAMSDMTVETGRGWKSAMRVRLLHAQVRKRILGGKGRYNRYDVEKNGIPINQADLLAVLGAFCVGPIWSMRRNGYGMSPREISAYQVAWRHVGYYLGISPSLLERYYGRSFSTTESSFASLAYSIFPEGEPPTDPYSTPQYKILSAVAARPPRGKPIGHHLELCRLAIGPKLAQQLALPRGTLRDRFTVESERLMSWALLTFGDLYSRFGGNRGERWESRRRDFFKVVVELLVVWQLGQRRTVFAWRGSDQHSKPLKSTEGEEPGVEFGPVAGKRIKDEWKSLMIELGLVVGSVVVAVGVGFSWGLKQYFSSS